MDVRDARAPAGRYNLLPLKPSDSVIRHRVGCCSGGAVRSYPQAALLAGADDEMPATNRVAGARVGPKEDRSQRKPLVLCLLKALELCR